MKIYALLDKQTNELSQPMLMNDEREVKSTYINFMCENPKSILSIYSTDYDIYELGTFDLDKGLEDYKLTPTKIQVCNLSALKGE